MCRCRATLRGSEEGGTTEGGGGGGRRGGGKRRGREGDGEEVGAKWARIKGIDAKIHGSDLGAEIHGTDPWPRHCHVGGTQGDLGAKLIGVDML